MTSCQGLIDHRGDGRSDRGEVRQALPEGRTRARGRRTRRLAGTCALSVSLPWTHGRLHRRDQRWINARLRRPLNVLSVSNIPVIHDNSTGRLLMLDATRTLFRGLRLRVVYILRT